jgi:hypothetical protein
MTGTWTKPTFEEFDVNGECTAYAGGLRAEALPSGAGSVLRPATSPDPGATTPDQRRGASR